MISNFSSFVEFLLLYTLQWQLTMIFVVIFGHQNTIRKWIRF